MIGVIAHAADHDVVAGAAIQLVVAVAAGQGVDCAVADDDVVEFVARAVDGRRAGEGQVLEVGAERDRDRAFNTVRAFARYLR